MSFCNKAELLEQKRDEAQEPANHQPTISYHPSTCRDGSKCVKLEGCLTLRKLIPTSKNARRAPTFRSHCSARTIKSFAIVRSSAFAAAGENMKFTTLSLSARRHTLCRRTVEVIGISALIIIFAYHDVNQLVIGFLRSILHNQIKVKIQKLIHLKEHNILKMAGLQMVTNVIL